MLRHWLTAVLGIAGAAAVFVGGLQWTARPASYRAAVIELLKQREVAYATVQVREDCWPAQSCFVTEATHTLATVVVWRDNARYANYGQLSCYDRRGDCYLDIVELGIVHAPLRDLREVRTMLKPLARVIEDSLTWVRMLHSIDTELDPPDRADYDRGMAAVRAALGEQAFATAWAAGQALALDQAVAEALAVAAENSQYSGK